MKSSVSTYAFINAKLRGRLAGLATREFFRRMIEAPSMEEAVRILEESHYGSVVPVYEETGDLLLMELEIEGVARSAQEDVRRYATQFADASVASFIEIVLRRFSVATYKNALRLWFERTHRKRSVESKIPYLLRGDGDDGRVEAIVNASSAEALAGAFRGSPCEGVVNGALDAVERDGSLFPLEIALDRWYYRTLQGAIQTLNRRDQPIAQRLIGIEIDAINVNWIVRTHAFHGSERVPDLIGGGALASSDTFEESVRSGKPAQYLTDVLGKRIGADLGAPGASGSDGSGTARSLALLETVLHQMLAYESRRALGGYPFSIGVVLAYFALTQQEARGITTVLNGKYYDLSRNRIGALL